MHNSMYGNAVYNTKGSSRNQSAKRFIGLLVDGLVGCIGIRNLILNEKNFVNELLNRCVDA